MTIKFDRVNLLENIFVGTITFLEVRNVGMGTMQQYLAKVAHTVYYDAVRDVFFTKEIYDVFGSKLDLIKFYEKTVGEVRSYIDEQNSLFFHDIKDLFK
ncbi:hypothetical protein 65p302 [Aeromonas phage 65]|uniref:Uncharacterized protein n=2 Tax=Ishigurovirus osborne TaxID=260149 RepID=A0A219YCE9_9CAUD|nr:hypothetical protein ST65p302 [Aeromonas phage 65]ADQ53310.1 hypothetical protein 65p302 [Aeromonas phage 65]APU01676.1 hypothetical protein [Aeromonas phage 65.2]